MRVTAEAQERLRPPEERESPEADEEDTRQKESYIDDTVIAIHCNNAPAASATGSRGCRAHR